MVVTPNKINFVFKTNFISFLKKSQARILSVTFIYWTVDETWFSLNAGNCLCFEKHQHRMVGLTTFARVVQRKWYLMGVAYLAQNTMIIFRKLSLGIWPYACYVSLNVVSFYLFSFHFLWVLGTRLKWQLLVIRQELLLCMVFDRGINSIRKIFIHNISKCNYLLLTNVCTSI